MRIFKIEVCHGRSAVVFAAMVVAFGVFNTGSVSADPPSEQHVGDEPASVLGRAHSVMRRMGDAVDTLLSRDEAPSQQVRSTEGTGRGAASRDIESGSDWLARVPLGFDAVMDRLSVAKTPNAVTDATQTLAAERDAMMRWARKRGEMAGETGSPSSTATQVRAQAEDGKSEASPPGLIERFRQGYERYRDDVVRKLTAAAADPEAKPELNESGPRGSAASSAGGVAATLKGKGLPPSEPAGADAVPAAVLPNDAAKAEAGSPVDDARTAEAQRAAEAVRQGAAARASELARLAESKANETLRQLGASPAPGGVVPGPIGAASGDQKRPVAGGTAAEPSRARPPKRSITKKRERVRASRRLEWTDGVQPVARPGPVARPDV